MIRRVTWQMVHPWTSKLHEPTIIYQTPIKPLPNGYSSFLGLVFYTSMFCLGKFFSFCFLFFFFVFWKPNQNSCIHSNKESEYGASKAGGGESPSHTTSFSISLANRANECACCRHFVLNVSSTGIEVVVRVKTFCFVLGKLHMFRQCVEIIFS